MSVEVLVSYVGDMMSVGGGGGGGEAWLKELEVVGGNFG